MSWEDQGRQKHGWFGHGTVPPKVGEGAGLVWPVRDGEGSTEADRVRAPPPLMQPRLGSGFLAADFLGTAVLLNQLDHLDRARGGSAVQEALKRFGLDPASKADVAAARAYA